MSCGRCWMLRTELIGSNKRLSTRMLPFRDSGAIILTVRLRPALAAQL